MHMLEKYEVQLNEMLILTFDFVFSNVGWWSRWIQPKYNVAPEPWLVDKLRAWSVDTSSHFTQCSNPECSPCMDSDKPHTQYSMYRPWVKL